MIHKLSSHNFTATYQEGIVSQIDTKHHKVKVVIPALEEFETAWLSYLTPNAGSNQFYCLPDKGELVAILLDAKGEGGCVLGTLYNDKDPTPTTNHDIWLKRFNNGTEISHNRKTGEVVVETTGQVTIKAASVVVTATATINGDTSISGNLTVSGTINSSTSVEAPSVSANGVSLSQHTHSRGAPPDK